MIICTINKNIDSYMIEVKGHSGYDTIGKDIVCSSVSTSIILTVNLLEKLKFNYVFSSDENIPMMKISLSKFDSLGEAILDNLISCLEDISKQYKKYLKIIK